MALWRWISFFVGMIVGGMIMESSYESSLDGVCKNFGFDYYVERSVNDVEVRCDFKEKVVKEKKGYVISKDLFGGIVDERD